MPENNISVQSYSLSYCALLFTISSLHSVCQSFSCTSCVHKLFFVDVEYCSAIPIAEVVFPTIVQVTSAANHTDPSILYTEMARQIRNTQICLAGVIKLWGPHDFGDPMILGTPRPQNYMNTGTPL